MALLYCNDFHYVFSLFFSMSIRQKLRFHKYISAFLNWKILVQAVGPPGKADQTSG